MEYEDYKNKYFKYKKKYLKLKNIYGGINIKAKEFIPKNKKTSKKTGMDTKAKEFVPQNKKTCKKTGMDTKAKEFVPQNKKTGKKKGMDTKAKEFVPKKTVKMIEKKSLEIVTHNLGGQTYYIDKNNKSYLSCERGEVIPEKTKNKYKTIEELSKNIPPPELNEDTDIYLFQEWQTQETSGTRINDLVIQTKLGKTIYGKNRYLDYSGVYLIDTMKKEKNETIIIKNVHLPIVSETSSLSQIEKLIKILDELIEEIKGGKIILGGDFNFDFNNIDYENIENMLKESVKKDVSKNTDRLMKNLKKLYSEFNSKNLIIYPKKSNMVTNIWSLRAEGELTEKCVDYIMISKNLEKYIDIKKSKFDIDESYIGGSVNDEEIQFLKNDYDHARLKIKLVLNDRYRIGYINE